MTDLPKSINSIVFLQRPTDVGWRQARKPAPSEPRYPSSNTAVCINRSRASTILAIRPLRRNVWGSTPALVASFLMSSPKPQTITVPILQSVKARCVINEQLSLALLADVVSFEEDINGAVEVVSVRNT